MKKGLNVLTVFLVALALALPFGTAEAKTKESLRAEYDTLWSAALRLLRVNLDLKVLDKDKETGYIVFLYKDATVKESRATMEIKRDEKRSKDAENSCTVQVTISGASSTEERGLINELRRKLQE